jgi:phosphoenolpyruvate carboxykinase (ATP)
MNPFDLGQHELNVKEIHRNLPPSLLYEHAIRYETAATIAENGALVAYSGEKTGRSPKDKRIVKNSASEKDVWWGTTNVPLDPKSYRTVRQRAVDYLNVCANKLFTLFQDNFKNYEADVRQTVVADVAA